MRVTGNTFSNSLVSQLNALTARQYRLQNQIATGQRIHAPEDDPTGMQRALGLRAQCSNLAQYQDNISNLQGRATAAYDSLRAVKKISDRASEIAALTDDTRSSEELSTYATEVTELIKQAVQLMNNKYREQYLFGGTSSGQSPFTIATDADGNVTSVTYSGNTSVAETEIGTGATIAVDVPGENSTGTGPRGLVSDSRSGADFFNHLISLQNHLLAGDVDAVMNTDCDALQKDEDNFILQLGNNGAIQTRLETAASMAEDHALTLKEMSSKETDADMAQTIVELNQAQTAYQAALQSGAGVLQMSLMDFL